MLEQLSWLSQVAQLLLQKLVVTWGLADSRHIAGFMTATVSNWISSKDQNIDTEYQVYVLNVLCNGVLPF